MQYILASASPRRKELFSFLYSNFLVQTADIDESIPAALPPEQAAEFLACQKAKAVCGHFPNDLVVAADTTVVLGNTVLGKPENERQNEEMLLQLSGKTHQVYTGVCLCLGEKQTSFTAKTDVCFYPLTSQEMHSYVRTKEGLDKAGGYGIQGFGSLLVKEIHGDYFNVVGLPVARLRREIAYFCAGTKKL